MQDRQVKSILFTFTREVVPSRRIHDQLQSFLKTRPMRPMHTEITPQRIQAAERLIRPYIRRTPVLEANAADFGLAPANLTFKLELFQHAGSFKARGAFTNLLSRDVPEAGVVAASGGNHGAAVAFAAMKLGIKARIYVP